MKTIKWAVGLLLLGCCGISIAANTPKPPHTSPQLSAPVVPVNRIAAIVNNDIITQTQLDNQVNLVKMQLGLRNTPLPSDKTLQKQVLDQLINEQLQLQLAKRNHIQVNSAQVNQAIAGLAQNYNLTADDLYKKAQENHLSRNILRQQIKNELTTQTLQQAVMQSRITITPKEVTNYLQQQSHGANSNMEYHVEDILVSLPATPSSQQIQSARDRANDLVKKLNNGANFQQLAVAHSSGQEALKGGDLGWRHFSELPDAFAKVVSNLQKGQVAGPIHTPNGFHIIKLVGTRSAAQNTSTAKDVRKQATQALFQQKLLESLQSWVSQLRAQAYVKIYPLK